MKKEIESMYKKTPCFYAKDIESWRRWLSENHEQALAVWLIIFHKNTNVLSIYYPEAVDQALCFGWIDSKPNKRDSESYYVYFSKRNPKSNWSAVNKSKVEVLNQQGLMAEAGLKMVELAKKSGTWTALEKVDQMVLPELMIALLEENQLAKMNFEKFSDSTKKGILDWIYQAKQIKTLENRIRQTVEMAEKNLKANQYKPTSN